MPINLTIVEAEPKTKKRFTAIFRIHKGGSRTDSVREARGGEVIKIVNFGQRNPKIGTYIDHKDKQIKKNYIARHEVTEKKFYTNPMRAATLSRFILWGPEDTLIKSIEYYKKKFNLS